MAERTQAQPTAFLPFGLVLLSALVCVPAAVAQDAFQLGSFDEAGGQTVVADYELLDDTPGVFTNFNAEAIRPIAFSADNSDLYALNTHGNWVARFDGGSGDPAAIFHTGLNPVALGIWNEDLFVVCQGSRVLLRMDRFTGEVVDLMRLPSEPQDIVIDPTTGRGFVSSAGEDVVVEIELSDLTQVHRYKIAAKRPRYLFLDADGSVFVAPSLSGNNSTVFGALGSAFVFGLDDPSLFPEGGLPDHDLFRIDPATHIVKPVLRGMGTILFGHARNPVTQEYWILNVDARNKDQSAQSEPSVNGDFADNRLSIAALTSNEIASPLPEDLISLDDSDPSQPGVQVADPMRSMATPQGLWIASSGFAFVASAANDLVTLLDSSGNRLFDFLLPEGSIPQAVALDQTETLLCVFCWGTNQVLVYSLAPFNNVTPIAALNVGLDPTPSSVAQGRAIFYDAEFSRDNRFTCGSCHPGGLADGIAWNISDSPRDEKGPMVTQPLIGLANIFPYHWRGERSLADFNVAFTGLLGNERQLDPDELDVFQDFIFSMVPHANPQQELIRRLALRPDEPPQANGLVGDPTNGQKQYIEKPTVGLLSCADCHAFPTGTNSDVISEVASNFAVQTNIDVTAFSNGTIPLKNQGTVPISLINGSSIVKPVSGVGMGHTGTVNTLFDFVDAFNLTDQEAADITEFIDQFDQGLAPAAQLGLLANQQSANQALSRRIDGLLLAQANRGWLGVLAFGTFRVGDVSLPMRWYYDPAQDAFVPEDGDLKPESLSAFLLQAQAGQASNVFLGVPPGNERRLGVDFDADGLFNADEADHGADPFAADTDDDGWPDGYEVENGSLPDDRSSHPTDSTAPAFVGAPRLLWANTQVAKLTFASDEPTHFTISYQTSVGPAMSLESSEPSTLHTAIIQNLNASASIATFNYSGQITLQDLQGNTTSLPLPGFRTGGIISEQVVVLSSGGFTSLARQMRGGVLHASASFDVRFKAGGPVAAPAPNRAVVGQVLVNGVVAANVTSSRPTTGFQVGGENYIAISPPFVLSNLSTVEGEGRVVLDFSVGGLQPDDKVMYNVIGVLEADPTTYDPMNPGFLGSALLTWSMPDTPAEYRRIETEF
jgi:hypothetical protein